MVGIGVNESKSSSVEGSSVDRSKSGKVYLALQISLEQTRAVCSQEIMTAVLKTWEKSLHRKPLLIARGI